MNKIINTPAIQVHTHNIIQDNSLFELTISKKYLGQFDIGDSKIVSDKMERLSIFEDDHTAIFTEQANDRLFTITTIEGIAFQAGASLNQNDAPGNDHGEANTNRGIMPILIPRRSSTTNMNYPLMDFIVRPPNGRSMYAIIDWQNKRFSMLWILISLIDSNGKVRLFRAPIPNSHPEGSICTGDLQFKDFSMESVKNVIKAAISGGFNADLSINYGNYGYFDQKNPDSSVCNLIWARPMHTIAASINERDENNSRDRTLNKLQSAVSLLELSSDKKTPLKIEINGTPITNSRPETVREENTTIETAEPVVTLPEGYDEPTEGETT